MLYKTLMLLGLLSLVNACDKSAQKEEVDPAAKIPEAVQPKNIKSIVLKGEKKPHLGAPKKDLYLDKTTIAKIAAGDKSLLDRYRSKDPMPHDTLPTDITAERPTGTVPNPYGDTSGNSTHSDPMLERPDAPSVISGFGVCRDQQLPLEEPVELNNNVHYGFDDDAQGWVVDGTYETGDAERGPLAGEQPEISRFPAGAVSFYVKNVDNFPNLERESVYTDFVSPRLAPADQGWRRVTEYAYQAQKPSNPLWEDEAWPHSDVVRFYAQIRVVVEKCDGSIGHIVELDENASPLFCQLNETPTDCINHIQIPREGVRKLLELRMRIYQPSVYTFNDERVVLFDLLGS